MEGPPLGPGGEDITWPDQVAPRGRKASSTRKIKPQTSNLNMQNDPELGFRGPLNPNWRLLGIAFCKKTIRFKCDRGPKCTGTLPSKCTAQCDTNLINHSHQPFEPVPFQGWQR